MSTEDYVYDAQSIQILEGVEAVRRRPGMYVGSVGDAGLVHMVVEIVDNAISEARAGFGDVVEITILDDRTVMIEDRGRGIPVEGHPHSGLPAATVLLTELHSGSVFGNRIYSVGKSSWGIGLAPINALSMHLQLDIWRKGWHWRQCFARGKSTGPLERVARSSASGTRITLTADAEIFGEATFSYEALCERFAHRTWFHPGLAIRLLDHRSDHHVEHVYPRGLADVIADMGEGDDDPIVLQDGGPVELAMAWSPRRPKLRTFANEADTREHGSHWNGLVRAWSQAIHEDDTRPWAEAMRICGRGVDTLLRSKFVTLLHLRCDNPRYGGSTRDRLANTTARDIVHHTTLELARSWIAEHPERADELLACLR